MDKQLYLFLQSVQASKSLNTYKVYQTALDHWFPSEQTDLSFDYINKRLCGFKCSQNTKALRCTVLKKYIEFYSNFGHVDMQKAILELLNSVHSKETVPNYVTPEQYNELIRLCGNVRLNICISLMYFNGLRASEVLNIKTKDYNFQESSILITNTKNGNDYKINLVDNLNQRIKGFLDIHPSSSEFLIHTSQGNQLLDVALRQQVKRLCIKAGYPELHCHSFRHGSAMYLLDNNVNLFVIKEHLRHKSVQSTQRYLHIGAKQKQQVTDLFNKVI